jgi:RNA ligase
MASMNYQFPHIHCLDDIKEVISDLPEFIIAEREWGYVVNYLMMTPDTFPAVSDRDDAIRRECRGLIFNIAGDIVSRPLHKFFNVGELDETFLEKIDLSKPHVILEKMDGSMIRPIPVTGGGFRLGTKMGITDISQQAERFIADKSNINTFILGAIGAGYTPIFEWCSRQQRIVIDYPEDKLVLIAVRHVNSGEYLSYQQMQELAGIYNLDLVQAYPGTVDNMQRLMDETRTLDGQEGWVIRWSDGHMVKLKGEAYVRIHKAKDALVQEKNLLDLILNEQLDDVKSLLPLDDLIRVENYERSFWHSILNTISNWKLIHTDIMSRFSKDRKKFALEYAPTMDNNLRGIIFRSWDDSQFDFQKAILELIGKNLSTATKVDSVRYLWGNVRWNNEINKEE